MEHTLIDLLLKRWLCLQWLIHAFSGFFCIAICEIWLYTHGLSTFLSHGTRRTTMKDC